MLKQNKSLLSIKFPFHDVVDRVKIVKWVCESLQLFTIIEDHGFQSLMKTGYPEYYIPLETTVI